MTQNIETGNAEAEESYTQNERTMSENEPEDTTGDNPTSDEESLESDDGSEASETESEKTSVALITNDATQPLEFVAPSQSLDEESYRPSNLIDSSLLHLHGLMKQVAKEDDRKKTSPEMINAVCNVAKNMNDLMKLKLAVLKESREMNG